MPTRRPRPTTEQITARPLRVFHQLPSAGRLLAGGALTAFAGNPERGERGPDDRANPNYGPDDKRHNEDDRKPRYKVELLARTFFGDIGVRPTTDPTLIFWESPDIWIDGPSGDPDQATPGVMNTVKVHVWNVGLADCWAAHVDLYWCDPSSGVSPAFANPIGSTVVTLMGGAHTVLSFPWVPSMANGGHECLVAQVYDPVSDPLVAPFSPTLDRHVAQRNISVVQAAAGQPFQMFFAVNNVSLAKATMQVSVELLAGSARERFLATIGAPAWQALGRAPAPTLAPVARRNIPPDDRLLGRTTGALREGLDEMPARGTARRVAGALRALAAPRASGHPRAQLASMVTWDIEPRMERLLELQGKEGTQTRLATDPRRGEFTAPALTVTSVKVQGRAPRDAVADGRDIYRIVERVGGRVSGGLTVIVKGAPKEGKKKPPAARKRGVKRARK